MLNLLFVLDFGGTASFLQHDVLFTNACQLASCKLKPRIRADTKCSRFPNFARKYDKITKLAFRENLDVMDFSRTYFCPNSVWDVA